MKRLLPYLFISLAPVVLFFVYPIPPTVQAGRPIDAFFYTGYINNFDELIQLYGLQYYSVRFGTILPGWIAANLCGPVAGFYVLRYVLTVVSLSACFRCVRAGLGTMLGIASVIVLLATPPWYRALLWDYVDSTAVPYLLIGASLLLTPPEGWQRSRAVLVGCLLALAVDSNVWAIPVAVFACVAGLVFHWDRRKRFLTVEVPLIVVGALLAHGAGVAFYYFRFGEWKIHEPTIEAVTRLSGESFVSTGRADLKWVTEVLQIYVLPFLLVTMVVARTGAKWCRLSRAAWTFGLLSAAFFFYWEFVHPHGGDVLYWTYYRSFLIPCWALLFPCALNRVCGGMSPSARLVVILSMSFVTFALPFWGDALPFRYLGLARFSAACAATFAALWWVTLRNVADVQSESGEFLPLGSASPSAGALARRQWHPVKSRDVQVAAISVWWLLVVVQLYAYPRTAPEGPRQKVDFPGPEENLDLYRLAIDFIQVVPKVDDGLELRFWIPNNRTYIELVQATYLGGFSLLGSKDFGVQGMPILDKKARDRLHHPKLKYVILLAATPQELDEGLLALRKEVPDAKVTSRERISRGSYVLETAVVKLKDEG